MLPKEKLNKLKNFVERDALVRKKDHRIVSPAGLEEDWLFDLRNIFLKPESLELIVDLFWEKFETHYPFQVGGQEVAAIPLVSAIVLKSRQLGKPVNGFIIRKERKTTGLQKIIEGELNNEKIILADDLINSGRTALRQLTVLEKENCKVFSFFTILNFREKRNENLLEKKHIKLVSLFQLQDFNLSLGEKTDFPAHDTFRAVWHFRGPDPNYFYVLPKSTPCLDEKRLYFGSDDGYLRALNQEDGLVVWKFKTGGTATGKTIFSSPALHKDRVIFGSYDGNVYALDKNNGELLWKYSDADWVGSSPAVAEDLGTVFIGLEYGLFRKKGGLVALNAENGREAWKYTMPDFVHCSPAFCKKKSVVAVGCNDFKVRMFNARNGKLLWTFETGGVVRDSLAFDLKRNLVIFGSYDHNVYAVDIDSGEMKGKFETKDIVYSTPLICGDVLVFTSTDKNIYCFNLKDGKRLWKFEAGGRIFSSPKIINGNIFVGANDGVLYELDMQSGKCLSIFQTTERITNAVEYNPKSKQIFLLTYANEIYCLEKDPGA